MDKVMPGQHPQLRRLRVAEEPNVGNSLARSPFIASRTGVLARGFHVDLESPRPDCENRYITAAQRVINSIANRLDHTLTNETLAGIACLSPFHFNRVFRSVTGIPPVQFLYALRV